MDYIVIDRRDYSEENKKNATSKARSDIEAIMQNNGVERILLDRGIMPKEKRGGMLSKILAGFRNIPVWDNAFQKAKPNDRIIIQYPLLNHAFLKHTIEKHRSRGVKFVLLVHDLMFIRDIKSVRLPLPQKILLTHEEKSLLSVCDLLIVHNVQMEKRIKESVVKIKAVKRIGIFDYLIPDYDEARMRERAITKNGPVIIAGNLAPEKTGYIKRLPEDTAFNLYGLGFSGRETENVKYKGAFSPEELPYNIEGSFGLVWDGDSSETCTGLNGEYLRFNSPHKTSFYMASGIPVIIWTKAALASFILENDCGRTADTLNDVKCIQDSMTEEEYDRIKQNAYNIGILLRNGTFTLKAVLKA